MVFLQPTYIPTRRTHRHHPRRREKEKGTASASSAPKPRSSSTRQLRLATICYDLLGLLHPGHPIPFLPLVCVYRQQHTRSDAPVGSGAATHNRGTAQQSKAKQSTAKQSKAEHSTAKQSRAQHSKAKQSTAQHSLTLTTRDTHTPLSFWRGKVGAFRGRRLSFI